MTLLHENLTVRASNVSRPEVLSTSHALHRVRHHYRSSYRHEQFSTTTAIDFTPVTVVHHAAVTSVPHVTFPFVLPAFTASYRSRTFPCLATIGPSYSPGA